MTPAGGPAPGEWHLITCEYPPTVGGVSDYTFTLASELAAIRPVHVWCPASSGPIPTAPGVHVHPDLNRFAPRDLRRAGARLNDWPGPRRLLVQWVPQGYGYRSANVWLPVWLAWRAWMRRDELHLMVHEPFLNWSLHPRRLVAALLHRFMLAVAASGASRIWLSTSTWERRVRLYVPSKTPVEWLPIPGPRLLVPDSARGEGQTASRPGAPVIGHFGTHSSLVTHELAPALDVVLRHPTVHVRLIGRDSDTFRRSYLDTRPHAAGRVHATGVLDADAVAEKLRACDVMVQPYPDGLTSRRTSTLTLLALGLPVVTNAGPLTEPFWLDAGAVQLTSRPGGTELGEAALALLDNRPAREGLGARGLQSYARWFDPRHAVALLESASWPNGAPGARPPVLAQDTLRKRA